MPIEFVEGIVRFPFAVMAKKRFTLPLGLQLGGDPLWELDDPGVKLLAPAVKYYIDVVLAQHASSPAAALGIGLAFTALPRAMADVMIHIDEAKQQRRAASPVPPAAVPAWAAPTTEPQAPPPPPVTGTDGPRDEQPTKADFWAGAFAPGGPA
jgi:hypothetical protein